MISKQDKLQTLKKYGGIIYNRIPDAEQELSTFYQHIKMTYCYQKQKSAKHSHFIVHFYSFTVQSHVQSISGEIGTMILQ